MRRRNIREMRPSDVCTHCHAEDVVRLTKHLLLAWDDNECLSLSPACQAAPPLPLQAAASTDVRLHPEPLPEHSP